MLLRTNNQVNIGFFVPSNLKVKVIYNISKPILSFYWINNDSKLVTSKATNKRIYTDDFYLIAIEKAL